MTKEDVGEMHVTATAALGLFPRVEIDPAHLIELCDLATEALKARDATRMVCPSCMTDQPIRVFDRDSGLCAFCEDERRRGR